MPEGDGDTIKHLAQRLKPWGASRLNIIFLAYPRWKLRSIERV